MTYYGIKCIDTNLTAKDRNSAWELTERGYEWWYPHPHQAHRYSDLNKAYQHKDQYYFTYSYVIEEMPDLIAKTGKDI